MTSSKTCKQKALLLALMLILTASNAFSQYVQIDSLERALKAEKDLKKTAYIHKELSTKYLPMDREKSIFHAEQFLRIAEEVESKPLLLRGLSSMQYAYGSTHPNFLWLSNRAHQVYLKNQLHKVDTGLLHLAYLYELRGLAFRRINMVDSSALYLNKAIEIYINKPDPLRSQRVFLSLAELATYSNQFYISMDLLKYIFSLEEHSQMSLRDRARAQYYLGYNYLNILKPDSALKAFSQGANFYEMDPRPENTWWYTHNLQGIAETYLEMDSLSLAIRYYERTKSLSYEQHFPYIFEGIANVYLKKQQYDSAIKYLQKTIAQVNQNNDSLFGLSSTYELLSVAYLNMKKADSAEYYLRISDTLLIEQDSISKSQYYIAIRQAPPSIKSTTVATSNLITYGTIILLLLSTIIILSFGKNTEITNASNAVKAKKQQVSENKEVLRQKREIVNLLELELSTILKSIEERTETISKIRAEIRHLKSQNRLDFSEKITELQTQIQKLGNIEDDWSHFDKTFKLYEKDFLNKISPKMERLSSREFRIIALIRMNISSNRDIASMLNCSEETLKIAKTRMKNKLEIPKETNLTTYILSI